MKRSGMTNTLRRLVRRFWVPRAEYDGAIDTLRAALDLIVRHHDCGKRIELGCACPHCTDANGQAPVLERIYSEIHAANGANLPRSEAE